MQRIAILLTCHNRKNKTLACLDALYKCTIPDGYLIDTFLVDDGCTDGTADEIEEKFPTINIIKGRGNLYWNGGMRLAWVSAAEKNNYDFYLWLNDDTNLMPHAIGDLLQVILTEGDNSIACGITQSFITNEITYSGFKNDILLKPDGTIQPCDTINGNIVLIPQKVFKKVGFLDKSFTHSIGDIDYGFRAKKLGVNLYITSREVGFCEKNERPPLWCRPEKTLSERVKNLYSPLGYSTPFEYFIFEKRHYGFYRATKHFITIHVRLLFPKLWL